MATVFCLFISNLDYCPNKTYVNLSSLIRLWKSLRHLKLLRHYTLAELCVNSLHNPLLLPIAVLSCLYIVEPVRVVSGLYYYPIHTFSGLVYPLLNQWELFLAFIIAAAYLVWSPLFIVEPVGQLFCFLCWLRPCHDALWVAIILCCSAGVGNLRS